MAISANRGAAPDPTGTARVDLAAALGLAARCGVHEGICNHFSLAVPGAHDRFLLNPYGRHWSEIRASDERAAELQLTALKRLLDRDAPDYAR